MNIFTKVVFLVHNTLCIFSIGFHEGWPLYLVDSVEDENGSCIVVNVNQILFVCAVNAFDVIDSTLRTREVLVA